MADNPLGFFWGNDPNVNQQLRQRIALQLMGQGKSKGYPKNIGEGLTAIGDSIGDLGMMRRLEQGDLAEQAMAAKLKPPGAASASYAPSEDTVTPAPAAAAIDRAITPSADTAAVPQQPGPPLTADEQKAGVSPGDYNVLDAQTNLGFKPTPGYMQDAIAAKEKDPEMQAYYGQLSGKEAKDAQDVSPTGAAGPFQITRGTGKGLGLTPDQRFDPAASTDAVRTLTAQNAAVFEKVNGRPPTFQELALMHQQGGMTGARMAAGTGNAPPGNLAVNNIPRGASPAQAVAGINRYYQMPNAPAPVGQRDAIASQLVQQPSPQGPPATPPGPPGGPLPNPTLAGATAPLPAGLTPPPSPSPQGPGGPPPDQRLAMATPMGVNGIQPAPPMPSGLRAMPPPQQVAQNAPQPRFDYVMPQQPPIAAPKPTPIGSTEQWAQAQKDKYPNNSYIARNMDQIIAQEQQKRAFSDKTLNEDYTRQQQLRNELEVKRQEQIATQAQRGAAGAGQAAVADIQARTGMTPEQFFPEMDKQKAAIDQTVKAQDIQQLARKAIRDGVITGYGANFKVAAAKFADWALKNGMSGDLASNTEIMSAALKTGLRQAVETVNGSGPGVSNADVRIAEGISGSDPELQMKTIKSIMDQSSKINNMSIQRYEDKIDHFLAGHPQEMNYTTNSKPVAPPDKIRLLLESQADPTKADAMRSYFDERYGPGAADLELTRFHRAQRRGGR